MGDKRRDSGEYYPGGRVIARPGTAPQQIVVQWTDVQGKPQIAPLPERYRESDMKVKINEIASKFATAIAVALVGWTALAGLVVQKAQKNQVWNDEEIVTNVYLAVENASGSVRTLPKYLWVADFDDSYSDDAKWYYEQPHDYGNCSSVRDGNTYSRNLDWKFNNMAEVIVRMSSGLGRFASLGVANVGTNLTEEIIASGAPTRYVKALPGHTVDGINENGVVVNVNVVDGPVNGWAGGDIHPLGAVRWVLDHATSALDAATNLAARICFPQGWSQNFHWMVADADETYYVENGKYMKAYVSRPVMTNYPLIDTIYGTGLERHIMLSNGANITNAWWTLTYTPSGYRPSDLPGIDSNLVFATWSNGDRESHRGQTFDGMTWWQTVHTSVYDISNRVLRICVQEKDDWYVFKIPESGGVSQKTVREIVDPLLAQKRNKYDLREYRSVWKWVYAETPGLLSALTNANAQPIYSPPGPGSDHGRFDLVPEELPGGYVARYPSFEDEFAEELSYTFLSHEGSVTARCRRTEESVPTGDKIVTVSNLVLRLPPTNVLLTAERQAKIDRIDDKRSKLDLAAYDPAPWFFPEPNGYTNHDAYVEWNDETGMWDSRPYTTHDGAPAYTISIEDDGTVNANEYERWDDYGYDDWEFFRSFVGTLSTDGLSVDMYITDFPSRDPAVTITRQSISKKSDDRLALLSQIPTSPDKVGAFPAASGETLQQAVQVITVHMSAEDAKDVVTNYDSTVNMPSRRLEYKIPDGPDAGTWRVVWDELTRWNWLTGTYLPTNFYTKAEVDARTDNIQWGLFDSQTGNFSPEKTVQISSDRVILCKGASYQRTVTEQGSYWVWTSNEPYSISGVESNGYFRIEDAEGNTTFEIVKGDKVTAAATADGKWIENVMGITHLHIHYPIEADTHPTLEICNNLTTHAWKKEDETDCLANVSWSGTSGDYWAEIWGKTAQPMLFVRGTYMKGSDPYVRYAMALALQTVKIGNTIYYVGTASISGHTVLTLSLTPPAL